MNAADERGFTALRAAALAGNIGIAGLLIEQGADVNAANKNGDTALTFATKGGHTAIVEILRAAGAK